MINNSFEQHIYNTYKKGIEKHIPISQIFDNILISISDDNLSFSVEKKVEISNFILSFLDEDFRIQLCKDLLNEQIIEQRNKLEKWGLITAQSSQIDTGYIAQHLVSLRTQIPGQGMRGKGLDLSNGSEVKAANFLDSQDKKGAVAPRWNFTAITPTIMEKFLTYTSLYLLSIDQNPYNKIRIRIWKIDVTKNELLTERYKLWMNTKGYVKFKNNKNESVNFQLFPPRNKTNETFARHGNNRLNGFPAIEINLEDNESTKLIFYAVQNNDSFDVNFI